MKLGAVLPKNSDDTSTYTNSVLFDVNPNEADAILEREAQRQWELIDQAVERFAPHLQATPDVRVIHVHSSNASLRKAIREEFTGAKTLVVEHCFAGRKPKHGVHEITHEGMILPLPEEADLVATKTGLTKRVEWLGARLKAQVCVIPESFPYIWARLQKQGLLVIVGGEQA